MIQKEFQIGNVTAGLESDFFVIAGPCVIESEQLCIDVASKLVEISGRTGLKFVFKASFDKANRTSISSFRGPGIEKGLDILQAVRELTKLPLITDVHLPEQASMVASVVDCLQVPAFLCRQTDLLVACAETGKPVNVKKGQFVSPGEMKNVVEKLSESGCNEILLTERGTFFGYNSLVNDMTAITVMHKFGVPVVFDATHSTQQPGGGGSFSAGRRETAPTLAYSAVAAGAEALFLEVHPDPENALCDSASMMPLEWVENVVTKCKKIFDTVREK